MTTILRERENDILIKLEEKVELGGHFYRGVRYEWWNDKEKMKQDIPAEGNYIYCAGYAGCTDAEAIEWFEGVL
jgi:hypothetical protein